MAYYQIFTSIISILFFGTVFLLIRRDSILMGAALRWFSLAIVVLVLGLYPQLSNIAAGWLGISYPPILPVTLTCVLLLIKALLADIERAKAQVKVDRIAQKLAMVEMRVRELTERQSKE